MPARVGTRVLRGPDWSGGEEDGGEGHLGTVKALLSGNKVRVLWDNGNQSVCRTGADGKFDLRVFDTAPVGVRHDGVTCAACEDKKIYGMMWRCKSCKACDLCALCYVTDKHAIQHEFLRYDEPGRAGVGVKKRSASLKIRALGIFPGAKVKRGKDWIWADQDGGEGNVGEVTAFENVAPDSSRNMVRVQWSNGSSNSYRLGFQGNVDLKCVEEQAGLNYYKDHLPVLDTSSVKSTSSPTTTSDNVATLLSSSSSSSSSVKSTGRSNSQGSSSPREVAEGSSMKVGDKVVVQVDEEKLKELQAGYGGHTATMIKCVGKTGEVASISAKGAIGVKFGTITFRFNPQALVKVPRLGVGDMVRIRSDLDQVKRLNNKRVGWKSAMEETLGKVGQVTKIDSDGDVVVLFGRTAYMFTPACCLPVSASTSGDSLGSAASCASDASSSSSDDSNDYGEFHRDMMKLVAQMLGVKVGGSDGGGKRGGSGNDMDRLFKAIAVGDTQTVRSLCQSNKSLVNRTHKDLTPLVVASHEGKKDVCSCLLAMGADINQQSERGNTPLGAALEGKNEDVALYLLEKGADPNTRNSKQRNPVHLAAYNNMPVVIKLLVQKGASVNAKDQYGDAPLHDAIDRDNAGAVDMLLRAKNIDLQAQNKKGFNLLQHASLKGNAHATERILLRDAGHVDQMLDGRFSALHIAANNDHVDCVKLLVKNGKAQINLAGHKKQTPLHLACMKGHFQSTEALVEMGAALNVQDDDGDTPLHDTLGVRVDNPETLRGQLELKQRVHMACVLLSKGAYLDVRNKKGAEPLQCCSHPSVRNEVQQFIRENSSVIRRSGAQATAARGGERVRVPLGGVLGGGLLGGFTLPCGAAGCSRMSDITLMPCGHKTLCRNCCLNFSECPLCDSPIQRRIHRRQDKTEEDLAEACRQM